jgi:hypothetical protein
MRHELTKLEKELYIRVDEVLHYIWDPIGVSIEPHARDEYDAYVPQVFGLLKKGVAASIIAAYLTQTTVDRMGLRENQAHDLKVAQILIDWGAALAEKHGQ